MRKEVEINSLKENFFQAIGKEWMLVAAGTKENCNMMTASWGGTGILWGKPVAFVFIRPERYTRELMDQEGLFSLSFMGDAYQEVHKICGSQSGRQINKMEATGLTPFFSEEHIAGFEEARLTIECKTLYRQLLDKESFLFPEIHDTWYNEKKGNLHIMYVAEITRVTACL